MIERRLRQIGNGNSDRLAIPRLGFGGIEGQQNRLEAGERNWTVRGWMVDAVEIDGGDKG